MRLGETKRTIYNGQVFVLFRLLPAALRLYFILARLWVVSRSQL